MAERPEDPNRPGGPAIPEVQVQLPSGGGTIRSPVESVGMSGYTGAAELRIAIAATPARGFEPRLSVGYSSSNGNSVFGLGFALSLSRIAVRTSGAIPRYDGSDVFTLDGETLVPLGSSTLRLVSGETLHVAAYVPRILAGGIRVERITGAAGGAFWRVLRPDGSIAVYGKSAGARIADPDSPDRIASWLVEEEFDPRGNARVTRYKRENREGVAPEIWERGRVVGANLYPERVLYGNAIPLYPADGGLGVLPATEWHFEIVFDYGEYDIAPSNDDPYAPVRTWPARPDPYSSYATGFECRTYRLCRNVLLFHHFPELGAAPVLTTTLRFDYAETPAASLVAATTRAGYRHRPAQPPGLRYEMRALPSTRFAMVPFAPAPTEFIALTRQDRGPLPGFQEEPNWTLVDLYGEGVPGVLYADGETVRYWTPTRSADPSSITYLPTEPSVFPIERRVEGPALDLQSLEGNGVVSLVDPDAGGQFAFVDEATVRPLRRFEAYPDGAALVGSSGADLSGTGTTDRLTVFRDLLRILPSRGLEGFAPAVSRLNSTGLPPAAGALELIMLTDPIAAGGQHYVRIRNGDITVWPNLGYGRFGAPVTMGGVPLIQDFDPACVRLADIDGSGALAFAYVHSDHVAIYPNSAGNFFEAAPILVPLPFTCARPGQVSFEDVLGNGYSCLIATTDDPAPRQWFFDLCGGVKPYLLATVDDQRGAVTTLRHSSSTRFYLDDKARGLPWITSLPFPVQVLARIETVDALSATRSVQAFTYHDGAYDPVEREFRGFGNIETLQQEVPLPGTVPDGAAIAIPALTRAWYEVGEWERGPALRAPYRRQWYEGDPDACPMPLPAYDWGGVRPDARDERQARIACAGTLIRRETFGLDGSAAETTPYQVEMHSLAVRMIQPAAADRYAIFRVHAREDLTTTYDRDATDPLTRHQFTLAVDDYDQVKRSATITYPRRNVAGALPEQQMTWAACETIDHYPAVDAADALLAPLTRETRGYRLLDPPTPTIKGLYYGFAEIDAFVAAGLAGGQDAQLMSWSRYRWQMAGDSTTPALQALLLQGEQAAFDSGTINGLFGSLPVPGGLDPFLARQGGYRFDSGYWWKPGALASYGTADAFYLLQQTADPFVAVPQGRGGTTTRLGYDAYSLVATSTELVSSNGDTADETIRVQVVDYQKLMPVRMTDANGIVREVIADPLGVVTATSFRGQEWQNGVTVANGFATLPVEDPGSWPTAASLAEFVADPQAYVNGAAEAYHFDPFAFARGGLPNAAAAARPQDYGGTPIELGITYSDGTGRELATASRVEPGDAFLVEGWAPGDGPPPWGHTDHRWQMGPRVRYNGAGEPFRTCQPCYTDSYVPVGDEALATFDLAVSRSFDAMGRVVRTNYPKAPFEDAFYATERYGAWQQDSADQDDTIKTSPYYNYYITEGHELPQNERQALERAAKLADTPSTAMRDGLGRTIRQIARLRADAAVRELATRSTYDLAGRLLSNADPRLAASGHENFSFTYALTGEVLRTVGCDAGTRLTLADIGGAPIFSFDGNGTAMTGVNDSRGRLIESSALAAGAGAAATIERRVYGDSLDGAGEPLHPAGEGRNLAGQATVSFDNGGRADVPAYALIGQPLATSRRFLKDYRAVPDWAAAPPAGWTWAQLFAGLDPSLQDEDYPLAYGYDARGRPTGATLPDQSVIDRRYHVSGRLARVDMGVGGAAARPVLADATYSARNQRERRSLADSSAQQFVTREDSFDPDSGLIRSIRTTRDGDGTVLQDQHYFQDPVGNLSHVSDLAAPSQKVVAGGQVVTPDLDYEYDSLYRLASATGRAMKGLNAAAERAGGYQPFFSAQDPRATENYLQHFSYDDGNNLTSLAYLAGSGGFTTAITIEETSNRGYAFGGPVKGIDPFAGLFDGNGNQLRMSGVQGLAWTVTNTLACVVLVARENAPQDAEYYAYDSGGNRVRKVTRTVTQGGLQVEETLYCGALEIWRRTVDGKVVEETHRLVAGDGADTLCETLSWKVGTPPVASLAGPRYPLANAVNSALLEIDDLGRIASYEEYAPYGATVYAAAASLVEMQRKEYRYNGRQRDKATGLVYYGARYAAPWLGRWMSPDPAGPVDGLNLFAFVSDNPVTNVELNGLCKNKNKKAKTTDMDVSVDPVTKEGSGYVGPVSSMSFSLKDAEKNYFELNSTEISGLTTLLDRLNGVTTATSTGALDIIDQYQIRRVFRDMAPNNFGLNVSIHPLWEEANKGEDTDRKYTLLRKGMTPVLKEELPETYSSDFFRKPEIHHATYQSVVKEWENTPQNLYLVTRGGRGIIGQHDALHLISSAGHGSQWKTLVPSVRSVIEDETGMKLWSVGSRPEYLFAPRQVEATDDRLLRTNVNKLVAEAIATVDGKTKSALQDPNWTFRMTRL